MKPVIFNRAAVTGREIEYVTRAITDGPIHGDGPFTRACHEWLERLTGSPKALLTTSCTHALEMAAILLDLSSDSHVKRVLRLELFAESSPEGLALEISKRLATIGKSSSRIHWRKRAAFARDLDLHRRMIERLADHDATAALDLMLDLVDLATPVLDRLSQAEGPIGDVFLVARDAVGAIAAQALPDPIVLADRVTKLLRRDDYAQFGPLVNALAPALGETGQAHLRQALEALSSARAIRDARSAIYKDALRRLADASGDVDAFEPTFAPDLRRTPLLHAPAQFEEVVIGGARKECGMASFAEVMSKEDAQAVLAYIIQRANQDAPREAAPSAPPSAPPSSN